MHVLSTAQQEAWSNRLVAAPEEVLPGLWAVAMPMPGEGMPSSFAYAVIDADRVHIIDPGWGTPANLALWGDVLQRLGRTVNDVETILITHAHPDHIGLAPLLRESSEARILMSNVESSVMHGAVQTHMQEIQIVADRLQRWGVPDEVREQQLRDLTERDEPDVFEADTLLNHGDTVQLGAFSLQVLETPGHTTGHLCFVDEAAGIIFTGDHVLPGINPGLGLGSTPGSDPLTDYLGSLHAMTRYDALQVLPGHEYRFTGLADRAAYIAAHHLRRTRAIAGLVPELRDAPVWEYASRSPWSRGWERMSGFLLHSALTQTEVHLDAVRSGRADPWLHGDWPTHV